MKHGGLKMTTKTENDESKIYGYARVSTKEQNLDTQLIQLEKYGVDEIVSEKITGVAKGKPKLESLIERLTAGDTLVVIRMDRLGRNTKQLLELVEDLQEKDVHLVILDMNIDTRSHTGKLFLTIMAGFSEAERAILKEKQRNGIENAKKKGIYKGRPKRYSDKHAGLNHAIELKEMNKYTVKEICSMTGITKSALYRKINERKEKELVSKI